MDIRDALFDEIYNIASSDKNVIFVTADADAFSLRKYKEDLPEQFINVGVAEQNMVAVASGLALSGKKVFIYAMIPFIAMRCYEHIKVNICSMNLPITIIGSGAGLSFGNDGPTHHAMQDIAVMRTLPEITIYNPSDSPSASACARLAYESNAPTYIRIDKGEIPALCWEVTRFDDFTDGLRVIREISNINIISTGFMSLQAVKIAHKLPFDVGIIDLYRIKPLNERMLLSLIDNSLCLMSQKGQQKWLITLEENSLVGGIGSLVGELLTDNQISIPLKRIALEDKQYFDYGSREWMHKRYGLDVDSIAKTIVDTVNQ